MAKKKNSWVILILIIISFSMIVGFLKIYENNQENLMDIITLFSIPLVIGAIIFKHKEYNKNGKGFLLSSILLFVGLLLHYTGQEALIQGISHTVFLLMGTIIFVFNLLSLLCRFFKIDYAF